MKIRHSLYTVSIEIVIKIIFVIPIKSENKLIIVKQTDIKIDRDENKEIKHHCALLGTARKSNIASMCILWLSFMLVRQDCRSFGVIIRNNFMKSQDIREREVVPEPMEQIK